MKLSDLENFKISEFVKYEHIINSLWIINKN